MEHGDCLQIGEHTLEAKREILTFTRTHDDDDDSTRWKYQMKTMMTMTLVPSTTQTTPIVPKEVSFNTS
jgi:hypothetical protein